MMEPRQTIMEGFAGLTVSPRIAVIEAAERALERVRTPGTPNTEKAYKIARNRWYAWCAQLGVKETPIDAAALVTHLEELSVTHAPQTVRLALAALSQFDVAQRVSPTDRTPISIRTSPIVHRWLRSWSRSVRGRRPKKAPALVRASMLTVTQSIMQGLEAPRGVSQRAHERAALRDRALYLVGWLGCMRRSEIAALNIGDLEETDRGVDITIQHSKANQLGPPEVVGVYRQQSDALCAVGAWRAWRARLEYEDFAAGRVLVLAPDAPAFPRVLHNGDFGGRMSGDAVGGIIKRRATDAGLAALGHSLRRGFASESAHQRKSEADIQKHGRWKSAQTVREYIDRESRYDRNPTEGIT